jgi:transposase
MKPPEIVNATQAELDELLAKAKPTFSREQYLLLERVFGTFVYVMLSLQNAKTSIKRFQRMLFGGRTEHKRDVLERAAVEVDLHGQDAAGAGAELAEVVVPAPKPRSPGHGRNGSQAYSGAPIVECDHPDLEPGDRCPECDKGKVYDSPPKSLVKVVGQAPLGATVYRVQRLRCRLCDAIFTAPLPAAVASLPKYDSSCASMIAVLRFGNGMPHFRLEGLQASLYIPLPDATQWDIVAKAAPSPRAVFEELIRQAAQAPLLHSDDTPMKVLSLMKERARAEAGGVKPVAKAINTSGIVAVLPDNEACRVWPCSWPAGHHVNLPVERFATWRAVRKLGMRIPPELWAAAVEMVVAMAAEGTQFTSSIHADLPEGHKRQDCRGTARLVRLDVSKIRPSALTGQRETSPSIKMGTLDGVPF